MKAKLAKGVAWVGAAKIIVNLLALGSTIILARLLTPEDFGVVALATTMLSIVSAVTELSLASALIHHKAPTDTHFHTAWTLNLSRAVFIGILFCAGAPIASKFYNEPRLLNIMIALGASIALAGFSNPKTIILTRQLVFWQEFLMTVSQKLAAFIVGISIAFFYKSYWALVASMIAYQLIGIIVSYIIIPFIPKFSFSYARELWSFSIWLTLGKIVNTLNWKFDHLLIGSYLGSRALGYYTVGDNLAGLPTRETIAPLEITLFPGFKQIAHDLDRLRSAYRSAQSLIFAIVLPIGVGCALIAHPLVLLAMGSKWLPAVNVIQVLSCVFALQTLSSPVHPLAMAKGETKLLFNRDLISFVIRVPIIIAGMFLGGLLGIIYARSITGVIAIFINMYLVRRLIGIGVLAQISANMRSLLSVIVMSGGVLVIEYIVGGEGTPIFLKSLLGRLVAPISLSEILRYDEQTLLAIKIVLFIITGTILYITVHLIFWLIAKKPLGPEAEVIRMASKLAGKFKKSSLDTHP
jgi:lipopolysaccharide exporter